ncbi:P-loop containing nucleoside triphosphate hydrolase protein [Massarina eburnea CBS 473.64]|uniref:P-loop containing nucleoside triphosphate hydrolase protein n=1 Tax=Massarina eburnea CBS 473.64 TaxID=1395130 RepID=A0A6A6RJD1_9PLEO|nr:P-loop containing nucleoside triphosphate hydrolase protein [Massarina eburnea CBS 473.64]
MDQKWQDWNWYWETLPPTWAQRMQANAFFGQRTTAKFLKSVAQFRVFPDSDVPEVAFVGRSNVGKSSLLNAIVDSDMLARTSATRGFTKTMNIYGVAPSPGITLTRTPSAYEKISGTGGLTIVDMPGYGSGSLFEWGTEIMKYLQSRKQLRRVFVLVDAEHGIKDKDTALLDSLRLGGISHQIVLSKLDRIFIPPPKNTLKNVSGKSLKPKGTIADLTLAMTKIRAVVQPSNGAGALGEMLGCSADVLIDGKLMGIDAVRFAVVQAAGVSKRGASSTWGLLSFINTFGALVKHLRIR